MFVVGEEQATTVENNKLRTYLHEKSFIDNSNWFSFDSTD